MKPLNGPISDRLRRDTDFLGRFPATPHKYEIPRGWYCTRDMGHSGPCAADPRWWMKIYLFVRR